jgi:tetratricopeptide (TPR) repeat protein
MAPPRAPAPLKGERSAGRVTRIASTSAPSTSAPAGTRTTSPMEAQQRSGRSTRSAGDKEAGPHEPTSLLSNEKVKRAIADADPSEPTRPIDGSRISGHFRPPSREAARRKAPWEVEVAEAATEIHQDPDVFRPDEDIAVLPTSMHAVGQSGPQLELDLDVDGTNAPPRSVPNWRDGLESSRSLREVSRFIYVAAQERLDAITPAKLARLLTVLLLTLMALSLLGLLVVSQWQTRRIDAHLSAAEVLESSDVYGDYQRALARLKEARNDRVLAEPLDRVIFGRLPSFFVGRVLSARERAYNRHLLLSAYVEARFEHADARDVGRWLEEATPGPQAAAARIYHHLALEAPHRASQLADTAWNHYGAHPDLVEARLEALLAAGGTSSEVTTTAQYLRPLARTHGRIRFLLLRADLAKSAQRPGAEGLREFLQNQSPEHVGARLAMAELISRDSEQHERAVVILQTLSALSADRASPLERARAHHQLAVLSLAAGEQEQAETHFLQAVRLVPLRGSLYEVLVDHYVRAGRLEDARRLLSRVPQVATRASYFDQALAHLHLSTGRPDSALELLAAAEQTDTRAAWLRGWAYLERGQLDEARQALHQAGQGGDQPGARALALYARVVQAPDRIDAALAEFEVFDAVEHQDPMVSLAHGRTLIMASERQTDYGEESRLLQRSAAVLSQGLAAHPNHALLLYELCAVRFYAGDSRQAQELCQQAIRANGEYPPGIRLVAMVRTHLDRPAEALRLLEGMDTPYRDRPEFSLAIARAAMDAGDQDRARNELNRWVGTAAESLGEWILLEGRQAYLRKDYPRAIGYFQRAYRDHVGRGEAALYYGLTLQRLGRNDEAREVFQGLREHPRWGAAAREALRPTR